ncbi:putative prephenate dehydratase [Nakaseomyces bracarensis]|uniref:prephenate dehydratase n=1 Tax=Nakaseomyces bracarensis TaxID=273131 RepID=A0ABR4NWL8_9SACH
MTIKVLFLGPEGTYSHQAAIQQFSHLTEYNVTYEPMESIPQCVETLLRDTDNSNVDVYSVVPLENSTNGQVVYTYDILRNLMQGGSARLRDDQIISPITIVGEQFVSILHCLIGADPSISVEKLDHFRKLKIYSHPQVWGQVSTYLSNIQKNYPNLKVERINCSSTSEAVLQMEQAHSTNLDSTELNLAIASKIAASIYDCHVIEHSINDKLGNTTRFLVFKKRSNVRRLLAPPSATPQRISLLTFTIKQDDPGSLVEVLSVLKNFSLNMCSISSRPYLLEGETDKETDHSFQRRNWQYIFFIEYFVDSQETSFDAEKFYDNIDKLCSEWCHWGTFPRDICYYKNTT